MLANDITLVPRTQPSFCYLQYKFHSRMGQPWNGDALYLYVLSSNNVKLVAKVVAKSKPFETIHPGVQ